MAAKQNCNIAKLFQLGITMLNLASLGICEAGLKVIFGL